MWYRSEFEDRIAFVPLKGDALPPHWLRGFSLPVPPRSFAHRSSPPFAGTGRRRIHPVRNGTGRNPRRLRGWGGPSLTSIAGTAKNPAEQEGDGGEKYKHGFSPSWLATACRI